METIEDLTSFLQQIGAAGLRGRLREQGESRALIRQNGLLPEGAPAFSTTLDVDLAEVAFSALRGSFALREAGGDLTIWRNGFARAGNAFEALVQNGLPDDPTRGFNRVMGAGAYHLAGYSALAFSLMSQAGSAANLAPTEEALVFLLMRDLDALSKRAKAWLRDTNNADAEISRRLETEEIDPDDAITIIATTTIFRAFAFFHFALQTGEPILVEQARSYLGRVLALTKTANAVSLWWISRLALNLIDDLWNSSLHVTLPKVGPLASESYARLRGLFIGELFARKVSEIELWPSQMAAAQRSTNPSDDLVVALPTSAGKTRIAEIATLVTLAQGRRVLLITPLRALSAQTERSFRRTFAPLNFKISSLYGAGGLAGADEDALRSYDIVIATPEKLDFALRNDPDLINDVGLVVLDEGHLIGPNEREIRYENLVQRLLRRSDSTTRRMVCLSAILPEGEQLDDLTSWIRSDEPGEPIQSKWRPTRQKFGTLSWSTQLRSAKLTFNLEKDGPFIQHFVRQIPAIKPRKAPFPKDNKELTLATAWKFSELGKRTLIFCTQRDHVESFAETVADLHKRGFLKSLLADPSKIERALEVGREWLGEAHPALLCLPLGVAIHHARLPSPFLREVEALLAGGVLEVIIASPTLAQGLNLSAAVLLIPNLYRAGQLLTGEEFANVAGRAGRAFVDLDGLVLHVMFKPEKWRFNIWAGLVNSARARALSSGIITVVNEGMRRLARTGVFARADAMEYLANSQNAWFPGDLPEDTDTMVSLIERLDATVLGLVEALDADSASLPALLDAALTGSLWARQISRLSTESKGHQLWIMIARARLIWTKSTATQRRAQFAMGVGLESGLALDAIATEVTVLLDLADAAAMQGEPTVLGNALVSMAEKFFQIRPFVPEAELPANWRDILRSWSRGDDVAAIGLANMRVVEEAFIYRLAWAMEAIRMRRRAQGGTSEYVEGSAAACVEAGLPRSMMAMLIRAGLSSRVAARIVIDQTEPIFTNLAEMNQWLSSNEMTVLSQDTNFPSKETASLWRIFRENALATPIQRWNEQSWQLSTNLLPWVNTALPARIDVDETSGAVSIVTPDYQTILQIKQRLEDPKPSLFQAKFAADGKSAKIDRMGRSTGRWREES
ncbi:DEAD/DEAH box helicase [Bradyrhizobium symbiodeficiens]|uniref:DEAD/DEAH box helicase n=1 Tax=Bradyrhizobium symbiodeficiens TaxID=1404367 RepID=A0A6G9A268_9BRAD|nr:DEAD/DEAH box helicase [Bradyrhizobium symbiodeficiens]QIP06395.1 DEAD/DEAH box helicase [Bradyrhizobium symbiodeficiens]